VRVWALAAVLTVGLGGALEYVERSIGYGPSVTDSVDLWAYHRWRLDGVDTSRTVALLGASRMQCAVDLDTFRRLRPDDDIIQLAVAGLPPFEALRDLAQNTPFNGVVVCSYTSSLSRGHRRMGHYVNNYHKQYETSAKYGKLLEQKLRMLVQDRSVFFSAHVSIPRIARYGWAWRRDRWFAVNKGDRTRWQYIEVPAAAEFVASRLATRIKEMRRRARFAKARDVRPTKRWLDRAAAIRQQVERIQQRGGRVVIIRLPLAAELRAFEETMYPRELYWDRIAELTGAETIHFQDIPAMAALDVPDGTHLCAKGMPVFTELLTNELVRRGVLP